VVKIISAEYIGSFGYPQPLPADQRPEVAFFGRSNVGKSTLINKLLGRRHVARTSKTPGKTRSANYFKINDRFFFVDMPGYGYAKVPKSEKDRLNKIIKMYLEDRPSAKGVVQLLDIRHKPSEEDQAIAALLKQCGRRICVVFNKVDKVKRSKVEPQLRQGLSSLDLGDDTAIIPFSSLSGIGKQELWTWIDDTLFG
jgi:GTP-binding protein